MGKLDPIMVVPQCFTFVTDEIYSLREQILANTDLHTLEDPLGKPEGPLDTGFHDFISGEIERFWEAKYGSQNGQ